MPYKDKRDRAEAVRRHRERMSLLKKNAKWIGDLLTEHFEFEEIPFSFLVEKNQKECVLRDGGVYDKNTGKDLGFIQVFIGPNMVVLVETTNVTVKPH